MKLLLKLFLWFMGQLGYKPETKDDNSSQIEVEKKYRISEKECSFLPGKLERRGFRFHRSQEMTDTFVPAADQSEMIRIRDVSSDGVDGSVLTLKKWIEIDGERVRQERETESLDPVSRDCILEMGSRLAKDALLAFSKKRVEYQCRLEGKTVTVTLDEVEGLGENSGYYMEVEVLAHREEDVKQALSNVEKIALDLLGESRETASSYMEMLKQSRKTHS